MVLLFFNLPVIYIPGEGNHHTLLKSFNNDWDSSGLKPAAIFVISLWDIFVHFIGIFLVVLLYPSGIFPPFLHLFFNRLTKFVPFEIFLRILWVFSLLYCYIPRDIFPSFYACFFTDSLTSLTLPTSLVY